MSDAMLEYERAQTLLLEDVVGAALQRVVQLRGAVQGARQRQSARRQRQLADVNAKFKAFRVDYEAFGARSLKMAGDKAQALFDGFKSFARTVDDIDFLNIGPNPRGLIDPPDFIDGPGVRLCADHVRAERVGVAGRPELPTATATTAPPPPPPFVTNNTQAVRNYTAFAPEEVTDDEATSSAVPIPSDFAALVRVAAGARRPVRLAAGLWLAVQPAGHRRHSADRVHAHPHDSGRGDARARPPVRRRDRARRGARRAVRARVRLRVRRGADRLRDAHVDCCEVAMRKLPRRADQDGCRSCSTRCSAWWRWRSSRSACTFWPRRRRPSSRCRRSTASASSAPSSAR
jgi:hypothetical protein